MRLVIDRREGELIRLAEERGITHEVENLLVGDIAIYDNDTAGSEGGGVLFERKSWNDFRASFSDGRYREQKTRLLQWRNGANGRGIIQLIEEPRPTSGFLFRNVPEKSTKGARRKGKPVSDETLNSTLCSLAIRDRISWIRCKNVGDSLDWITRVQNKQEKEIGWLRKERDEEQAVVSRQLGGGGGGALKRERGAVGLVALSSVNGVSVPMARTILGYTNGFLEFMKLVTEEPENFEKNLANLKQGAGKGRRIGPAVAKRIMTSFRDTGDGDGDGEVNEIAA